MRNLIKANQAGQNFCPFYLSEAYNCEGMRCMAWRWDEKDDREMKYAQNRGAKTIDEAGVKPDNVDEYWEFLQLMGNAVWRAPLITRSGYCGRIDHE